MEHNFAKVGAFTPKIKVADTVYNANAIIDGIIKAHEKGVEVLVFPELVITGCTCGDLYFQTPLLDGAIVALEKIIYATKGISMLVAVGLPIRKDGLVFNASAVVCNGKLLGVVPKTNNTSFCANYLRQFACAKNFNDDIDIAFESGKINVPFGKNIIFTDTVNKSLRVGVEIGADTLLAVSPSVYHTLNGATLIVNPSSVVETVGQVEYARNTLSAHSSKITACYVTASAGDGESTTDGVYAGRNYFVENGKIVKEGNPFESGLTFTELDLGFIDFERSRVFKDNVANGDYLKIDFSLSCDKIPFTRIFNKTPFVPNERMLVEDRAELILNLQAEGLKKRIEHTNAKCAVLGISGGLDSTLALIVAVKAMQKLGRSTKDVIAVTMPCFGTTDRTYQNAVKLTHALGATLKKIDIAKSVTRHLKDIHHQDGVYDVTYENAQARERTQVIMDVANMNGGLVVGTGDLSELALGWATYNGDHMSMYGVNADVPKTLVRHLVTHFANNSKGKLKATLLDVLDTPVSPELLPVENGKQSQQTEDIVGPYILHDFYLYCFIRLGYSPSKIYSVASHTFKGDFSDETIKKWLKIFFNRFFAQQFKRSCLPDGVKVGTVGLSPRGDWAMPSDAVNQLWRLEVENL